MIQKSDKLNTIDELLNILNEKNYKSVSKVLFNSNYSEKYKEFCIFTKKGKERHITSPKGKVRIWQKLIQDIICDSYHPKKCVHGFIKGKSILTNAKVHQRARCVLNVDLSHFYQSITFPRVRGMFMSKPFEYSSEVSTILAQLCTYKRDGEAGLPYLPMGASTSPCIANIIASHLDKRLSFLAYKYKLKYTRYADDLTFSTTKKTFPSGIASFSGSNPLTGNLLLSELFIASIKESGFEVNNTKTRMSVSGTRHEVTGLVVNEFPNVNRKFVRTIRSMLKAWESYGLLKAEDAFRYKYFKYSGKRRLRFQLENIDSISLFKDEIKDKSFFKEALYGRLAYLKMIRGETDLYVRLCLRAANVDKSPPRSILHMKTKHEKFDIFISHASEDKKDIAKPIFDACNNIGIVSFLDEKYLNWGDSLTEKINLALGESKFFLAILSEKSLNKNWPLREINAALARKIEGKQKFLPLVVGTPDLDKIALTSDILHMKWSDNPEEIAKKIKEII